MSNALSFFFFRKVDKKRLQAPPALFPQAPLLDVGPPFPRWGQSRPGPLSPRPWSNKAQASQDFLVQEGPGPNGAG